MASPTLDFTAAVAEVGRHLVRVEDRSGRGATGVVWSKDRIVTVDHPLPEVDRFELRLPDGGRAEAALVGRDSGTDLALLSPEGTTLEPARFADAEGARVGELLVAVSRSPRGLSASLRLLAEVGPEWQSRAGGRIDRWLRTDVSPMPGFAGGALARADGSVLGLSTGALVRGGTIAIPKQTIARVVEALDAHGRVQRGYLGVSTLPVRLPETIAEKAGHNDALLVVGLAPDSPAAAAGVMLGDAILALGGSPTRDARELRAQLADDSVGKKLALRIVRSGELRDLEVEIGARP